MVGLQIKDLRKENNLTLKQLAEKTGLSVGYLSQLEREQAEPSLSSLRKIAQALNVPSYIFMDYEKAPLLTTKRDQQVVLRKPVSSMEYTVLSPFPTKEYSPGSLLLYYTLAPGQKDFETPIYHNNEEIVVVLKGTLTVYLGDTIIELAERETTIIQKNAPHRFQNNGNIEVEAISVMTPPIWTLQNL